MSSTNSINKTQWFYEKKYEHIMEIDNFSYWVSGAGNTVTTPTLEIGQTKWLIRVMSMHDKVSSAELVLSTNLLSTCHAAFEISIINSDNEKTNLRKTQGHFTKIGDKTTLYIYLNTNNKGWLDPNDRLTFYFEIQYFVSSSSKQVIQVPESRLIDDLNGLLRSGEYSDIILNCNGEQFKAHKTILASRSPVFAAMFKHEMEEKKHCAVDIVDMEKDVLREMLQYMYTDTVNDLEELASGLLAAADKYDLERLRIMCEQSLFTNLSVDNACDTLIVAETHSADQLRKQSIQFIKSHSTDVVNTAGWKRMIGGRYADLIAELIT